MRIIHVANHCEEIGNGIVNAAVDLACCQAHIGHRVAFASGGGSYIGLLKQRGVEHFNITTTATIPTSVRDLIANPSHLVQTFVSLRRVVMDFAPDIVHAHMTASAVTGYYAVHGTGAKLITTLHNAYDRKAIIMGVADRVICVSRASRPRYGPIAGKVRIVLNGPLSTPRRPATVSAPAVQTVLTPPAVLTIAGLYKRKGLRYLVSAFEAVRRAVPDATLHIVGNGPLKEVLQAQIDKAGLANCVILHGFVRDPTPLLRQADVFVLPSLNETFGLVLAEAREAGCAIVASHVDGIVEVLEGGQAGILVPARSHVALAQKLIELLSDRMKLQHWRERAGRNLDWLNCDRAARETLQVYDEVLQERHPGTQAARL